LLLSRASDVVCCAPLRVHACVCDVSVDVLTRVVLCWCPSPTFCLRPNGCKGAPNLRLDTDCLRMDADFATEMDAAVLRIDSWHLNRMQPASAPPGVQMGRQLFGFKRSSSMDATHTSGEDTESHRPPTQGTSCHIETASRGARWLSASFVITMSCWLLALGGVVLHYRLSSALASAWVCARVRRCVCKHW
jgi:hypothetical protein